MMKLYFKLVGVGLVLIIEFNLLVNKLLSSSSDEEVILGIVILILTIPFIIWASKSIFKTVKENLQ